MTEKEHSFRSHTIPGSGPSSNTNFRQDDSRPEPQSPPRHVKLQRFLHSNHQQQSMTYHAEHPQAPQCTQEPTPQGASTGWVGRRKQLKLRGSQSGVRHQFKQRKHLRFGTISLWRLLGQPCLPHPLLPLPKYSHGCASQRWERRNEPSAPSSRTVMKDSIFLSLLTNHFLKTTVSDVCLLTKFLSIT